MHPLLAIALFATFIVAIMATMAFCEDADKRAPSERVLPPFLTLTREEKDARIQVGNCGRPENNPFVSYAAEQTKDWLARAFVIAVPFALLALCWWTR